jgi:predicted N-acetyltransferase YhbS
MKMNVKIRQEAAGDFPKVFALIEAAFKEEEYSDHQEQFLVERLRNSDAFVPELSLVAEHEGEIVGHILLTKIAILNGDHFWPSLALAPVSVLPSFQRRGIGRMLILEAHKIAAQLGFESVVLLGHADYYPRFGYRPTQDFGIQLPFEAPAENCMILELQPNALAGVKGMVKYPAAFFG